MNLNLMQVIGRVGGDPEVKQLPSGGLVATFSIATNRVWYDKEKNKKEQTEWHNIVFFGDNVIEKVIEPYVKRGSEIYVSGRLQTRSWEKDGQKHYRTEIVGEQIQLGARGKDDGGERPSRKSASQEADDVYDSLGSADEPAHDPSATVQKRVGAGKPAAKKGRTTKSKDDGIVYPEEDINPDDIPF